MATITTGLDKLLTPTTVPAVDGAGFYARRGKRLFDIAASVAGLAITSPLLIVCALLVRLTSRGPVLFRQTRVGASGGLLHSSNFEPWCRELRLSVHRWWLRAILASRPPAPCCAVPSWTNCHNSSTYSEVR